MRTLIDDHLIMPGYHRALITFMRDLKNDYNVSLTPALQLFVLEHASDIEASTARNHDFVYSLISCMTSQRFQFNIDLPQITPVIEAG